MGLPGEQNLKFCAAITPNETDDTFSEFFSNRLVDG